MPSEEMPAVSPLRAFGAPRMPRSFEHESATKTRRRLKETARSMPRVSGVYFFFGENERLLYIGKAKCLRTRVGSYFAETQKRRPPKLRRLLAEIKRLEWRECGSELEALLLERKLIAAHLPALNRQHKRFAVYPYLLLSDEAFPRLTITRAEPLDEAAQDFADEEGDSEYSELGEKIPSLPPPLLVPREATLPMETPPHAGALPGLYLGPFTSPRHAAWTFEAVRAVFPLRSCEGTLQPDANASACFYHEIGRCTGPCVGAVSQAEYSQICDALLAMLRDGQAPQIETLRVRMNELAAQWRFEDAERVRLQLEAIEQVAARLQRLERMRRDHNLVIAQPALIGHQTSDPSDVRPISECSASAKMLFFVRGGAVRRILRVDNFDGHQTEIRRALKDIFAAPPPVAAFTPKEELDEMMILDRWLKVHGQEKCCVWMNAETTGARQWLSNALRRLEAA